MKALNLEKLRKKIQEKKETNSQLLENASKRVSKYEALDIKLTALDLLLESILEGTPGLTQHLETALRNLEELNKKDGAW